MAHSAEDITVAILERDYNYHSPSPLIHSDIRHGLSSISRKDLILI